MRPTLRRPDHGGSVRLVGVARMHPRRRAGRWLAALGACVMLGALTATPAGAADGMIDGAPLNVYANDVGRLQAAFDGAQSGEFYTGALMPNDGGLSAAVQPVGANNFTVYGRAGGLQFTPVMAPVRSGDGSAGNPWTLTTAFNAILASTGGLLLQVSEVVQYVNGTGDVTVTYTVTAGPQGLSNVRLYESASILPAAGSYLATGFLDPGPPRRVGGQALRSGIGGSGGLVEVSPWSHYQEATASIISNVISNVSLAATGFNDTIAPTGASNGAGVGVQWDLGALGAGAQQTRTAVWRFNRASALDLVLPGGVAQTTGQTARVTVTARNNDAGPAAGLPVRYTITGVNPGSGAVTTAADGTAVISWLGAKTGTDTLTAFVDRDGNGAWDVNTEPRQIVTVTFAPLPPPVPGKSVNLNVVSGQVFVKLPGSGRARQTTGPAKGFAPLTGQQQIPVGSQVDTKKGRVALTSAADTSGAKTQTSDFYQGIFQVKQALPKKKPKKPTALTTDLVMKGQIARSQCAPLKGARAAAESAKKKKKGPKAVLGKLWGNGKGKFRTNGKYSAATVRGTIWLVEDRCEGTFTKVRRGTVQVRDFKRKKTVTVKAGHTYLARAQRAASKAKRR
jgi:hypothetical protein